MATEASNRAAALKVHEGKKLTQDEERGLETARNTAGTESRNLDHIVEHGRPQ